MIFREIQQIDVPQLFVVRVATRQNAISKEDLTLMGITEESVSEMLRTTHVGWLCEVEHRVVGFSMGNREDGEMWVVAVLPDFEKQGVGAGLLTRVEEGLWLAGCAESWLTTELDTSLRAYGFYRNQGWTDWQTKDDLRYMKKINPNQAEVDL